MTRPIPLPRPRTLGLLLLLALVPLAVTCTGDDGWTTDSKEAEAALERCLDAQMKLYMQEARTECRRAIELDPDFVMPKLFLAERRSPEETQKLMEELRRVDLDRLNDRERFLVRRVLAAPEERAQLLNDYLARHPKDPFALNNRCEMLWGTEDWDEAEACYERLLDADPNWVQAQNRLGYVALARGRFDEAEERFETYRYIAPDQANPHDSMGELLLLRGRYDEAADAFEKALETRADFCASHEHLILTRLLQRREAAARRALARMEEQEDCRRPAKDESCRIGAWTHMFATDFEAAWELIDSPACRPFGEELFPMAYEAAVRSGQADAVTELRSVFERARRTTHIPMGAANFFGVYESYIDALDAEMNGDPARAATLYGEADAGFSYWNNTSTGLFKLIIRLHRADALEKAGDPDGARRVREEVRAVNPALAEDWKTPSSDLPP